MILLALILILLAAGILAWLSELYNSRYPKWVALGGVLAACFPLVRPFREVLGPGQKQWLADEAYPWFSRFNIEFHLAMDGLSLLLIALTLFVGFIAILSAWVEVKKRIGLFYLNLMWTLAGVVGVFLAVDMFLFFVFWEVMLVPMYFLIAIWGYDNRRYAALKFFLFTQGGGLLLLLSIAGLVLLHYQATGQFTFNYFDLLNNRLSPTASFWIFTGFLIAFAVKLPAVPFHSWLPDAHTQAPTAASVLLAGILLKTGGYGLFRFVIPLFPDTAQDMAPMMLGIACVGIIYGSLLAIIQTDLKRLIAYTSVSHMGFVLFGCFAFNTYAWQGSVMQMVAHGFSTSALFVMVGILQNRVHSRNFADLGGLWQSIPRVSALGLFFVVASLGMPGLGNFIAEFLVLLGGFENYPWFTVIAAPGLILAAVCSLIIAQKTFFGPPKPHVINGGSGATISDAGNREMFMLMAMAVALVVIGIHPQPVLDITQTTLSQLLSGGNP